MGRANSGMPLGPHGILAADQGTTKRSAPVVWAVAALACLAPAAIALDVGAAAPEFGTTTLEGRQFSLAETRKTHDAVVILFISTICPYSNYYNDLIRDMAAAFAKKGVAFVGVNSGTLETEEEARVHAREHGHAFDIIKDPEGRIAELLDARRTPEAFLVDSSGTLRYHGASVDRIGLPERGGCYRRGRRARRRAGRAETQCGLIKVILMATGGYFP